MSELKLQTEIFRYFIRKVYETNDFTNDEIDTLRIEFEKYLNELNLSPQIIAMIIPNNNIAKLIFFDNTNPLFANGFHPAFILHFNKFIEEKVKKLDNKEQ